jgi:hypothetical protein
MSELTLSTLLVIAAMVIASLSALLTARASRRLQRVRDSAEERLRALETELRLQQQSISGLTAGAVGTDGRLQRLESREKVLAERQETYENQQVDEQPYGQAIRLVANQGAGVRRLVDELDLSESEADLIVRLHGQRETA